MARPFVQSWATVVVLIVLSVIAVLLTTAVIDALASTNPSMTISIVSPTPTSPTR